MSIQCRKLLVLFFNRNQMTMIKSNITKSHVLKFNFTCSDDVSESGLYEAIIVGMAPDPSQVLRDFKNSFVPLCSFAEFFFSFNLFKSFSRFLHLIFVRFHLSIAKCNAFLTISSPLRMLTGHVVFTAYHHYHHHSSSERAHTIALHPLLQVCPQFLLTGAYSSFLTII